MAKQKMFNFEVLDTDSFLSLPLSAQALYFHLNLKADDSGFIGNPRRIVTYIGAKEDDLNILIAEDFLVEFDDDSVIIKR